MSINQFSAPNRYLPQVNFNSLDCINQTVDNLNVDTLNATNINCSNLSKISNGTVNTPSLSFLTSVSTGLYRPSNATLGVVANASERLRIDNSLTSATMPFNIGNTLINPVDYVRFSNVGGETQVKIVGNTDCILSFENGVNDNDFSLGIDIAQNAFIKSKTNIKVQDENGNDSVELTRDKNGIKLYNNVVAYTPSSLDYYEEFNSPDLTVSGGVSPITLSGVRFVRCGKLVTMYIPEIAVTGNNSALSIVQMVPARFLPSNNSNFYVVSFDSIANPSFPYQQNGHLDINSTTGFAVFYLSPNHLTFNAGGNCGIRAGFVSWITV